MHIGQYQDKDGQDLGEVVYLRLVVVNPRCVTVILNDIHDKSRHGVEGVIRVGG